MVTGREMEVEYDPMVGEDVAELVLDPGTETGIAIGSRGLLRLTGDPMMG